MRFSIHHKLNLARLATELADAHGWDERPALQARPPQQDDDGTDLDGVLEIVADGVDKDVVEKVLADHDPSRLSAADDFAAAVEAAETLDDLKGALVGRGGGNARAAARRNDR